MRDYGLLCVYVFCLLSSVSVCPTIYSKVKTDGFARVTNGGIKLGAEIFTRLGSCKALFLEHCFGILEGCHQVEPRCIGAGTD